MKHLGSPPAFTNIHLLRQSAIVKTSEKQSSSDLLYYVFYSNRSFLKSLLLSQEQQGELRKIRREHDRETDRIIKETPQVEWEKRCNAQVVSFVGTSKSILNSHQLLQLDFVIDRYWFVKDLGARSINFGIAKSEQFSISKNQKSSLIKLKEKNDKNILKLTSGTFTKIEKAVREENEKTFRVLEKSGKIKIGRRPKFLDEGRVIPEFNTAREIVRLMEPRAISLPKKD